MSLSRFLLKIFLTVRMVLYVWEEKRYVCFFINIGPADSDSGASYFSSIRIFTAFQIFSWFFLHFRRKNY